MIGQKELEQAVREKVYTWRSLPAFSNAEKRQKILSALVADLLVRLGHVTLEITYWKELAAKENLLTDHSYLLINLIDEEVKGALIDNPHQTFLHLVTHITRFFQKLKTLDTSGNIEQTIYRWSIQSDMLLCWIHLDIKTPLMRIALLNKYLFYKKEKEASSYDRFLAWHKNERHVNDKELHDHIVSRLPLVPPGRA